jgi:hypothetical protein
MSKNYILSLFFCATVLCSQNVFAQALKDTVGNKALFAKVEDKFDEDIGPQSHLYNGIDYSGYSHSIQGNAYFLDKGDMNNGSVFFDGFLYKNVPLLYDIYTDQLITEPYKSVLKLQLLKTRIRYFNLLGHHFIYIEKDPANPTSVSSGFYDELYNGKIRVLAYRSKNTQTTLSFNNPNNTYFDYTIDYYIYKNGNYYKVSNKGSFLKVLQDKKRELNKYK